MQSELSPCEEMLQRPWYDALAAWLGWTPLSLLWLVEHGFDND